MSWTDERVETLKKMWAEGQSASQIAKELGINFKQGYNGDLSSKDNGYVGGYMVKRLIEQAERQMASQAGKAAR